MEVILWICGAIGGIIGFYAACDQLWDKRKKKQDALKLQFFESTNNPNPYAPQPTDQVIAGKTYFDYRSTPCPHLYSLDLVSYLEQRYSCEAFRLLGRSFPVTILWKNPGNLISPDDLLGNFDSTEPAPLSCSSTLNPADYNLAREFIRRKFEAPPSPIQHEGNNYRLLKMDLSQSVPQISGAFGLYYDNVLTQYALEWELKRALLVNPSNPIVSLGTPGALPLREAIEKLTNPLINGAGRCASITVSTLLVFKRSNGDFYTIVRRRSNLVGLSPGLHHVVPAGMFEASNIEDEWSVESNVWRELLEEVYNEKEQIGSGHSELSDYLRKKSPIDKLLSLIKKGKAELSVTGVCCDLLNLRTELCTILFISDPAFAEAKRMALNWEFETMGPTGTFGVPWKRIDDIIENLSSTGEIVVSGAACLGLGREWVRTRHGI